MLKQIDSSLNETAITGFPSRFQRESLQLLNSLVEVKSSIFYLLNSDMRHRGPAIFNLDKGVKQLYEDKFRQLDPLNPSLFKDTKDTVVSIDDVIAYPDLVKTDYYQGFMVPQGHRYVADMFFRNNGQVIAVASLLRGESMPAFSQTELTMLRKVQTFLEYTLNSVYMPKRVNQRQQLQHKYTLTERELDTLELLIAGAANKVIARELDLSLATIKTHLLHIFQKTGVSSRTELLSNVLEELTAV